MVKDEVRLARQKKTAEVFTPTALVMEMLSKLPKSVWKKGKTFLDPAVGNGQFLGAILLEKIKRGHKPLEALQSLYGVDIMKDNVNECRLKLLKAIATLEPITREHVEIVLTNIVCANSLEYDFNFSQKPRKDMVDNWIKGIYENGVFDKVPLYDNWTPSAEPAVA